jgi:hypothetical protein
VRSIDIGVLDPFDETGRDVGGEVSELSVAILVVECCPWRLSRLMRGFLERIVTKVVLIRLDLRRQVGDCCSFIYLRSVVEVWLLATCVHSTASLKKPTLLPSHSNDGLEDAANSRGTREWLQR